jgi:hypothetical protein
MENTLMTSISIPDLLTIIYVEVDDWYQAQGKRLLKGKAGAKPIFSDSEMMSLMIAQDFIPYPGETQFIAYMRANHLEMFPKLVDQSQFNRRSRALSQLVERLRQDWVQRLAIHQPQYLLLDTKPIPVMGYKRSKHHSDFAGSAAYGRCAARNLNYFGYKLVMLTTLDSIPLLYDLVPANCDERAAAEVVLQRVHDCDILGDKGFIGQAWQKAIQEQTGNHIWTTKRTNQFAQNSPSFDALLNHLRERIEGTFHCLQNTGRNIERLIAKTVQGLCTRVILKVTALVLKILLRRDFAIDVQSFSISH